jgi:hypothetical protein
MHNIKKKTLSLSLQTEKEQNIFSLAHSFLIQRKTELKTRSYDNERLKLKVKNQLPSKFTKKKIT